MTSHSKIFTAQKGASRDVTSLPGNPAVMYFLKGHKPAALGLTLSSSLTFSSKSNRFSWRPEEKQFRCQRFAYDFVLI